MHPRCVPFELGSMSRPVLKPVSQLRYLEAWRSSPLAAQAPRGFEPIPRSIGEDEAAEAPDDDPEDDMMVVDSILEIQVPQTPPEAASEGSTRPNTPVPDEPTSSISMIALRQSSPVLPCGHPLHPAPFREYQDKEYDCPEWCPACCMKGLLNNIKYFNQQFEKRGGILKMRKKWMGMEKGPKRIKNQSAYYLLFRGYVDSSKHKEMKRKRKRGIEDVDGEKQVPSWRDSKVALVNFVDEVRRMAELEREWYDTYSKCFENTVPEGLSWAPYTAADALEMYEKAEPKIQYVPWDPAGERNYFRELIEEDEAEERRKN